MKVVDSPKIKPKFIKKKINLPQLAKSDRTGKSVSPARNTNVSKLTKSRN